MAIVNRALSLADLPVPPEGKTGWPWTQQSELLCDQIPDASEWPKISIVTPSYNQGKFIEETIRSVLLQGYPNLEYIVIDGGSTDESINHIKKYSPWLSYWVSEPDSGQTDAIMKGFSQCSGDVWNWLNSDDLLERSALYHIAAVRMDYPAATTLNAKMYHFGDIEPYIHHNRFTSASELACVWDGWPNPQPATFLSVEDCRKVGGVNPDLHYGMDYDLYLRLSALPDFQACLIDDIVALNRWHSDTKTVSQSIPFKVELRKIFNKFSRTYPQLLPEGWQSSKAKNDYYFELDCLKDQSNGQLVLSEFLKTSARYFSYIYKEKFFWSFLLKSLLRKNRFSS